MYTTRTSNSRRPSNLRFRLLSTLICPILLLMFVGVARAQESCELDEVEIGFRGKTCAFTDYSITLNGEAATGFGTNCISFAQFPNFTNKAWAKLIVDKTYQVTAGSNLCITHINFDVPKGYVLEIDGVKTKTIFKTDNGALGSGDGTWNVVVRKECECEEVGAGGSAPTLGSVIWEAGLGTLADGRSAERISIREKMLSSFIYTPGALVYSPPARSTEVDVVTTAGNLRQVKAPQTFADVVAVNGSVYEIRYYRPADVGSKVNGLYTLSGQPYVTWRISNPEPATTTKLEIAKIENGNTTDKTLYEWDPFSGSWTLRTGWTGGINYTRNEVRTVTYPTSSSRTETTVVSGNGQVISKVARTYLNYPWGDELVQEIVDPDAAALTTTYTYYENPTEIHRYRKPKSVSFPDGSWEKYEYDVFWNIWKVLRPWKDLSMVSATESNSHVTIYGYSNSDNGVFGISEFLRIPFDVEERINGVTVRKTRYNRSVPSVDPEPLIATAEGSYQSSNNGVPVNLISQVITTRYHHSASPFLAERVASIVYPDGRKDTFFYEKGNYVPNADPALSDFIPDANGLAQRHSTIHGTTALPDGVAFKTTKETSVLDQFGNEVLNETYVYNGSTYERIAWTVNTYDDRAHLTARRDHKGQLSTAIWNGDKKISEIDSAGIEVTYTYDEFGRIATQTKKGIAASGAFPAQPDVVTTFAYDAEGRLKSETVQGGTLSLLNERGYDTAGRLIKQKSHANLNTIYSYSNGGRTQTMRAPGGATEISENYLDGRIKSLTGTAVVARHFDYGVSVDGTRYTQEFTGSAGFSSPRWAKTTTDWIGRTITLENPSFTGTNVVRTSIYNSLNQLQKQTTTASSTRLVADKLFEYDELGREIRVGSDVDTSGMLVLSSTDRVRETDRFYEKVGSDWFLVTVNRTYLTDNNSTPTVHSQRERLNNFSLNGLEQLVSETTVTNAAGNSSTTTNTVDRAAKKEITIVDTPLSNINAISVVVNGLLQSSLPNTPQQATTYSYDPLGRLIAITDPRAGTSTRTYTATNGELSSTNDGAGSTQFEYYPATHLNAGKLKAQTNASGKKFYFNYNSRGQLVQIWGDAAYPIQNVYDAFGQRTQLHTFRGGQNWSSSVWPSSMTGAVDVTKWIYQEATGLITQKQDAALKGPLYTYDELGRVKTRLSARGITTTYSYDSNTGERQSITYSDSTPSAVFAYDRAGRQRTITDVSGSRQRTFNVAGELQTEQITGGLLDGVGITVGHDSFLRRNALQISHSTNTLSSQTYSYDPSSRLETVTSGGNTVTYAYYPNGGLLNTTTFTGGTNIARSYDAIGRLETITTTPASDTAQSYTYTYNNLSQRTRVSREDGSYWSYTYNDRGELVSGKKYWSDNSVVWGAQTEYKFDNFGNRINARNGGNQLGGMRQSNYTTTSRNQYSQRTVPGAVDATGTANTAATVTVNGQATIRKNEYFYKELAVDNTSGSAYQEMNIVGARNSFGAGGEDAVTEKGGHVFLPAGVELFTYDDDGNLTSDGRWNYVWDGENRLVSMEAHAGVPSAAKKRLEFSYDSSGRRIQKKEFTWNAATSLYEFESITKFIYDGWGLIAEIDGNNNLVRSYARDASSLLAITEGGNSYFVGYDGNENVTLLVKANTGTAAATYEYDPFGQTLKEVGEFARNNAFRFSSHYRDRDTGLIYYGYRYYNPQIGRWISRDPSEEAGGPNLYGFIGNNAVDGIDYLGLWKRIDEWKGMRKNYSGTVEAECGDTLSDLATKITGYASDWRVMLISEDIKPKQKVDISKLLEMLELRIRQNIMRATTQFEGEGFPDAEHPATNYRSDSAGMRRFFTPGVKNYLYCGGATRIVMAKGLADTLRRGEFDRLGYSLDPRHNGLPWMAQGVGEAGMWGGDMGWVENYRDLKDHQIWQGENVIRLEDGTYWAFPFSGKFGMNMDTIKEELIKGYVRVKGRPPQGDMPGIQQHVYFFDVSSIGMRVFKLRGGKE